MTDSLESYCIFWTFSGLCAQFCSLQSICLSSEGEKGHKWGLSSGTPITASDIWTCNHSSTSSLTDLTHFIRVPEEKQKKGSEETSEEIIVKMGLPWWLRWQTICLQCRTPQFVPWVGKIPWRKKWQPTPVLFPGEFHGQGSLAGYSPWGQ